jgi:hypothetical protein
MMTLNGKKPTYRRAYTLDPWNFGHWEFKALEAANEALGIKVKTVTFSEEADIIEYVRLIQEEYITLMEGHVFVDSIRRPAHLIGPDVEYVRASDPVYTFKPESGQVRAVTQLRCRIKKVESKNVSVVVDGKEYTRTEQTTTFGEWLEPEDLVEVKAYNISIDEICTFE